MLYTFLWTLLQLCIFLILKVSACPGLPNKLGVMTSDFDIEVGSPFNIFCTIYVFTVDYERVRYNVNSSHLVIKKSKKLLKNVKVVNETSVSWRVDISTMNESGHYMCLLVVPEANRTSIVCSTHVTVGYKPLPVDNFSCTSYNYENLTCIWEKPFNPVKTSYILWRNQIRPVQCPKNNSYESNCTWIASPTPSKPLYKLDADTLNFTLAGKNSLGQNQQYFFYSHCEIVLPNPPKLNVAIGKSSANVSYEHPSGMYETLNSGWVFKLCYTAIKKMKTDTTCENLDAFGKNMHFVEKLVPNIEYEFKLSCRLKDCGRAIWSANSTTSKVTYPDAPYLSPDIPPSALESDISANMRNITVFWEPIPEMYHNGPNLCYHVSYYPCDNSSIKSKVIECENSFLQVGNLPFYQCYVFHICPYNDIGVSVNCSDVTVEQTNSAMPPANKITAKQLNGTTYNISWRPPTQRGEVLPVDNYTLFWCKTPILFECKGHLNWINVNSTSVVLKNLQSDSRYNFAVATSYPNYTTVMKPATCILYRKATAISGSDDVANVFIKPLSSNSLKVEWRLNECFQRDVKAIRIFYCPVNATSSMCNGEEMQRNVSLTTTPNNLIILKDLYAKTNYSVTLSALTYDGFHVEIGPVYESTYDKDVEQWVVIGISIGVSLACCIVIVMTVICISRLKKRIEIEKDVSVQLPRGLDGEHIDFNNLGDRNEIGKNSRKENFLDSYSSDQDYLNSSLDELITQEHNALAKGILSESGNKQSPLIDQDTSEGDSGIVCNGVEEKDSPLLSLSSIYQSTSNTEPCPRYVRIELSDTGQQVLNEIGTTNENPSTGDAVLELEIGNDKLSLPSGNLGAIDHPSASFGLCSSNLDIPNATGRYKAMIIPNQSSGGKFWTNDSSIEDENDSKGNFLGAEDAIKLAKLCNNSEISHEPMTCEPNFAPYVPIKSMVFLYKPASEKDISPINVNTRNQNIGREDVRKSVENSLLNIKQCSEMPNTQPTCQNSGYVTSAFCKNSPTTAVN